MSILKFLGFGASIVGVDNVASAHWTGKVLEPRNLSNKGTGDIRVFHVGVKRWLEDFGEVLDKLLIDNIICGREGPDEGGSFGTLADADTASGAKLAPDSRNGIKLLELILTLCNGKKIRIQAQNVHRRGVVHFAALLAMAKCIKHGLRFFAVLVLKANGTTAAPALKRFCLDLTHRQRMCQILSIDQIVRTLSV